MEENQENKIEEEIRNYEKINEIKCEDVGSVKEIKREGVVGKK